MDGWGCALAGCLPGTLLHVHTCARLACRRATPRDSGCATRLCPLLSHIASRPTALRCCRSLRTNRSRSESSTRPPTLAVDPLPRPHPRHQPWAPYTFGWLRRTQRSPRRRPPGIKAYPKCPRGSVVSASPGASQAEPLSHKEVVRSPSSLAIPPVTRRRPLKMPIGRRGCERPPPPPKQISAYSPSYQPCRP